MYRIVEQVGANFALENELKTIGSMSKHLLLDLRSAFSPADSAYGICQFTAQDGIPLTMSNGVRIDWIDHNLMAATQMGIVYLPDYIESDRDAKALANVIVNYCA